MSRPMINAPARGSDTCRMTCLSTMGSNKVGFSFQV